MSLYSSSGQINTTTVNGSSYTGLYAPDGSFNIVLNSSSSYLGLYHPCGALNAVSGTQGKYYHPNGSVNVISNGSGGYYLSVPYTTISTISPEASAFLARTSGLDSNHITAYTNLINGLVADAVWPKLDMLHIYATQDATNALLNLVSTSYNGVLTNSAPGSTFTVDRGYQGPVGTQNGTNIDTGFKPGVGGTKFGANSMHISCWTVNDIQGDSPIGMHENGYECNIVPRYTDNNAYFRANDSGATTNVAVATATGLSVSNRVSSTNTEGWRNGVKIFNNASQAVVNPPNTHNIRTISNDFNGSPFSSSFQLASASIGSGLTAGDNANLYTRLRTYMTAVGVP